MRGGGDTALFHLQPPLLADERGRYHQQQLRAWHRDLETTPEDAVYFQCYRGEFANDSQLALHHYLRAHRPDLTLYWGVEGHNTALPEGAQPLLIGSREWYRRLASVRYLSNNIDFDRYFTKRPFQKVLATFHGYPFKSMGRTFWEGRRYTPGRIEVEVARRNATWDAILVPSAPCEAMYRTEYDYEGPVLVTGYPRNDILVTADAPAHRAKVLAQLGVPSEATVVLYAPTYRDVLTTRTFAAKRFDDLDLAAFTERLGPDHVVLLRGHNNNQRELDRVRELPGVVDVTDYPDINDLILAADVALLDYSSLRFDWAITGKPMIFYVPDLEDYFSGRPPLFAYDDTTPGPRVVTLEETVAAVQSLEDVRRDYAQAIADFNAEFNALHDGHATERVAAFFSD